MPGEASSTFKVYWQCMGVTCTWWGPWVVKGGVFMAEIGILGPSTRGSTACTTATPQQKSVGPEREKPGKKPLTVLPPAPSLGCSPAPCQPQSPSFPTPAASHSLTALSASVH